MAAQPVTQKEMTFAYYFLKQIGANLNNPYLISAVVAWLRAEVGYDLKFMYNKNNPLNIRKSKWASSYRITKTNGQFAQFSSLQFGAYAAADLLLSAGHDYRGYWRIVAAAKYGTKDDKAEQTQARDFLEAIALSKWDAGHYGLQASHQTLDTYVETENKIIAIWVTITGKFPTIKVEPDQPKQRKAKPMPPKSLPPPSMPGNITYLNGEDSRSFYNASRPPTDLGNLPPV